MSSPGRRPFVFRGIIAAAPLDAAPAHCSAPPLQAAFRLPRLSRDAESVTRPRMPLRPIKAEGGASEYGAVCEFEVDRRDEVAVKVEAEEEAEEPVVERAAADGVCAQFSTIRIAPPTAATAPRRPGRPRGSKSKPRVEPQHDISAPPEREKARMASAKIAAMRR